MSKEKDYKKIPNKLNKKSQKDLKPKFNISWVIYAIIFTVLMSYMMFGEDSTNN